IARVRARGEDPATAEGLVPAERAAFEAYTKLKLERELVDFDDLIESTVDLLEHDTLGPHLRNKVRAILLDEAQDTNALQMRIVELLDAPVTFLVGDQHQSIYGFQGADPEVVAKFARTSPTLTRYRLERSYRCPAAVANAATLTLRRGGDEDSAVVSTRDGGVLLEGAAASQAGEVEFIANEIAALSKATPPPSILVVARVATDLEPLSTALRLREVKHSLSSPTGFWGLPEIDGLLDAARLAVNPADIVAAARLAAWPPSRKLHLDASLKAIVGAGGAPQGYKELRLLEHDRGRYDRLVVPALVAGPDVSAYELYKRLDPLNLVGPFAPEFMKERANVTIVDFLNQAAKYTNLDDLLALASAKKSLSAASDPTENVQLSTIHAAKGGEADVVFVMATEEGRLPHAKSGDEGEPEERRLFYVATSRSSGIVCWTRSDARGKRAPSMSRYLAEIVEELPVVHLDIPEPPDSGATTTSQRPGGTQKPAARTDPHGTRQTGEAVAPPKVPAPPSQVVEWWHMVAKERLEETPR
ncbi:MAG: 3'-5' exonuclease, partial [Acidimicrobiales bacterium]